MNWKWSQHGQWTSGLALMACVGALILHPHPARGTGTDWPMWGYDAARSSRPPAAIPEELHLHWVRELPPPRRAWRKQLDDRDKLEFDLSYSPIVMDGRVFVASMTTDSLTAYDVETGDEIWRAYVEGPARVAPAAWRDRVFLASDDGHLHALDAATGERLWAFDARPSDHRVLGNERVISMWPARGGPVVKDGVVYFASGVWPFLRTFVFALDAETGEVQWANKSHALEWQAQPHGGAYAFAGVSPQGYLAAAGDRLVVSGGRSFPSLFDRHDGTLIHSTVRGPKLAGGYKVRIEGDYYFNHGLQYSLRDGQSFGSGNIDEIAQQLRGERIERVLRLPADGWRFRTDPEEVGRNEGWYTPAYDDSDWLEDVPIESSWQDHIEDEFHGVAWYRRAFHMPDEIPGGALYLHFEGVDEEAWVWLNGEYVGEHAIGPSGWDAPFRLDISGRIEAGDEQHITIRARNSRGAGGIWRPVRIIGSDDYLPRIGPHTAATVEEHLDSEPFSAITAAGRLFVTTKAGHLYAFGPDEHTPVRHAYAPRDTGIRKDEAGQRAAHILERSGHRDGYALVLGAGDGDVIEQLAVQSELHIVALEPDANRANRLRRRFDDAGLYGARIAILTADPTEAHYPKYISSLVVMTDAAFPDRMPDAAFLETVYAWLRPYDGVAMLPVSDRTADAFQNALASFDPAAGHAAVEGNDVILARTGALPMSGQWTHQYADAAQSVMSPDTRVYPPFGPIWFGGPTHDHIAPRHAAGPRPQVVGGRTVLMGVETISARCVYTGRELWVREFPGIGHPFTNLELEARWQEGESVYMTNQPGASFIGSPYVSLPDAVYVRYRRRVFRLDPATGETVADWQLPVRDTDGPDPDWGHISLRGDYVVTTTDPHIWRGGALGTWGDDSWDGTSSERLVVLNRHTGEIAWKRDAEIGFRHNAIVSGADRIFVNDLLSDEALGMAARRGLDVQQRPKLYALDLATGDVLWQSESEVFGTFFSYSEDHDILVEGGSRDGRRIISDEPTGRMIARRGDDGAILWERRGGYHGPVILRDDTILPARPGLARCLLTGENQAAEHPVTGTERNWSYWKTYGCGAANASPHLILFRSGAAGFADLKHDGGTSTLGGFRSGCTANMVAADGVLNAPDYTRTCGCSYQNQTSLGLIHMPEMEYWTADHTVADLPGSLRQAGINFGAPGYRRAPGGILWTPYPHTLAPGPRLDVLINTVDHGDAPVRIIAAKTSTDGLPGNTLDGNASTRWEALSNPEQWFDAWIRYELSEPVMLDSIEVAWTGPDDTRLRIYTSMDGAEWTPVTEDIGTGYGMDRGVVYRFAPTRARLVRLSLEEHGPDGGSGRAWARISQVRIGGLSYPDAYAYFLPHPYFDKHAAEIDGANGLAWVAATGIRGVRYVELLNVNGDDKPYTVSLHFAEPEAVPAGARVFDIRIQGQDAHNGFDPAYAAGGANRAVVRTFAGVRIADTLRIDFSPTPGSAYPPILSGVAIRREE